MIKYAIFLFCLITFSCKGTKSTIDEFQDHQIEIDLKKNVKPSHIESEFGLYGIELKCIVDRKKNIAVYSFNPDFTTIDLLINLLKNEEGVEDVGQTRGCIY